MRKKEIIIKGDSIPKNNDDLRLLAIRIVLRYVAYLTQTELLRAMITATGLYFSRADNEDKTVVDWPEYIKAQVFDDNVKGLTERIDLRMLYDEILMTDRVVVNNGTSTIPMPVFARQAFVNYHMTLGSTHADVKEAWENTLLYYKDAE